LYYSPDITGVMEPRHTKWVGLILHMGEMTKEDKQLVRKHEGRDHLCDLQIDVIILKSMLR
jgi:hypothetical protein